jgi:hypothetical protein
VLLIIGVSLELHLRSAERCDPFRAAVSLSSSRSTNRKVRWFAAHRARRIVASCGDVVSDTLT